jgi:hypothetical protein
MLALLDIAIQLAPGQVASAIAVASKRVPRGRIVSAIADEGRIFVSWHLPGNRWPLS